MLGNECITESFQRVEPGSEAARFARSEYRDAGAAWLMRDARDAARPTRFQALKSAWRGFRAAAARMAAMLF